MPYADPTKQRAFQREWLAKRRDDWIRENGPCACGSDRDLEVDHVDPKKKIDHKVWSWSKRRRLAELAKCQVLCSECHKKKTAATYPPRKHGTVTMRRAGRCDCIACKRAVADARAYYRRKAKRRKRMVA